MRISALILLALVACGGKNSDLSLMQGRVGIHYHGLPRIDHQVRIAFEEIARYGREVCGVEKFDRLFTLSVDFIAGDFKCGGDTAVGCYHVPYPIVSVTWYPLVWDSALAHEAAHHIWNLCRGRTGQLDDAEGTHEIEFLEAEKRVNKRICYRLAEGLAHPVGKC